MSKILRKVKLLVFEPKMIGLFIELAWKKLFPVHPELSIRADDWCDKYAISVPDALEKIRQGDTTESFHKLFKDDLEDAKRRMRDCPISLGGGASHDLLYYCVESIKAKNVIETGVAMGWSSLSILLSLDKRDTGKLISTDIPYLVEPHLHPKNSEYVGVVVPEKLKSRWSIIRRRDKKALPAAIKEMPSIDLCHYDSDKSYTGRMFAYPILWKALKEGGIFISDDVADNQAFRIFCERIKVTPIIAKTKYRYIGIIFK